MANEKTMVRLMVREIRYIKSVTYKVTIFHLLQLLIFLLYMTLRLTTHLLFQLTYGIQ